MDMFWASWSYRAHNFAFGTDLAKVVLCKTGVRLRTFCNTLINHSIVELFQYFLAKSHRLLYHLPMSVYSATPNQNDAENVCESGLIRFI